MTQEQIIQGLKEILRPLVKKPDAVNNLNPETNIVMDLGLDSIGLVYVVMQFEGKFNIKLGDIKPGQFKQVKDFINYVIQIK